MSEQAAVAEKIEAEPQEHESPKTEIVIQEVLPQAVEKIWPYIEDMIRQVCNSSDVLQKLETPSDVRRNLMANKYGLWLILADGGIKAAITMGIEICPRAQICKCYLCGGTEIKRWMGPFHQYIVERAREANCRFLQFEGNGPWVKLLQKFGFKKTSETFTLEI